MNYFNASTASFAVSAFIVVCCAAAVLPAAAARSAASSSLSIIHLSDLHADPYFGTSQAFGASCKETSTPPGGLPGCDSSYALVQSTLADVAAVVQSEVRSGREALFVYTGDFLRHDMKRLPDNSRMSVATDVFSRIVADMASANLRGTASVPGARCHAVIGLHGTPASLRRRTVDSSNVRRNYHSGVSSEEGLAAAAIDSVGNEDFLPDYGFDVKTDINSTGTTLHNLTQTLQHHGFLSAAEAVQMNGCGYYSRDITLRATELTIRVVVLNTVLWSTELTPATDKKDPCHQFDFFTSQLQSASALGFQVIVLGHIPPCKHYWHFHFVDQYSSILQDYSDVVIAQLFGHEHRAGFGAMGGDASSCSSFPPMFIAGGITRKDMSNPQYSILRLDEVSDGDDELTAAVTAAATNWGAAAVHRRETGTRIRRRKQPGAPSLATSDVATRYLAADATQLSWAWGNQSLSDVLSLGPGQLSNCALLQAGNAFLADTSDAFWPYYQYHEGYVLSDASGSGSSAENSGPANQCDPKCQKHIACSTIAFTKEQVEGCH